MNIALSLSLSGARAVSLLPGLSLSASTVPEGSAQGTDIATLTPTNASNPGAVSIASQEVLNLFQMNVDGVTLEVGSGAAGLDYATRTSATVTLEYTDDNDTYQFLRTISITQVAPSIVTPLSDLTANVGAGPWVIDYSSAYAGSLRTVELYEIPVDSGITIDTVAETITVPDAQILGSVTVRIYNDAGEVFDEFNVDTSVANAAPEVVLNAIALTVPGGTHGTPVISSSSPTDNATDVAVTVDPTVTFDRNIAFGSSGTITLYDVTGAAVLEAFDVATEQGTSPGQVSISGAVLTLHPTADLDNSNEYAIQWTAGAVESTTGVPVAALSDTTTISFTTEAAASGDVTVNGSATSFFASTQTDHTVDLPTGITSGELLVILFDTGDGYYGDYYGSTPLDLTPPAGWNYYDGVSLGTVNPTMLVFWKIATGSEGSSVTFTTSGASDFCSYAFRIANAHATKPFDGMSTLVATTSGTTPVTIPAIASPYDGSLVIQGMISSFEADFTWSTAGPTAVGELDHNSGSATVRYYSQNAGSGAAHNIATNDSRNVRGFQLAIRHKDAPNVPVFVGRIAHPVLCTNHSGLAITGLTGGVGAAPINGDLVIASYLVGTNANRTPAVTGYTQMAYVHANASNKDVNFYIGRKFMGSTPDTTVDVTAVNQTSSAAIILIEVWRNVDQTTPIEASQVNGGGAGVTGTAIPNPSAVTPTTAGAKVCVTAAAAHDQGAVDLSSPDLGNVYADNYAPSLHDVSVLSGSIDWPGSGAVDPAAFTFGGTDNAGFSNVSMTYALKPAA